MTEKELEERIDALLEAFFSLAEVQRLLALKKALREDKRLNDLLAESKRLQKMARVLSSPKKEELLRQAKEKYLAYKEDPLVINLEAARREVLRLVEPLTAFPL